MRDLQAREVELFDDEELVGPEYRRIVSIAQRGLLQTGERT